MLIRISSGVHLAHAQQLPGHLLFVLGNDGMKCTDHILDGVLLVGAIGLFAFLELIKRNPKVPGNIPDRNLFALNKLGIGVTCGDSLYLRP